MKSQSPPSRREHSVAESKRTTTAAAAAAAGSEKENDVVRRTSRKRSTTFAAQSKKRPSQRRKYRLGRSTQEQKDGEPPVAAVQASSSSSSSSAASSSSSSTTARITRKSRKRSHSSGATVVTPPFRGLHYELAASDIADSDDIVDESSATLTQCSSFPETEPTVASPLVVEDPQPILLRNVDCYVSGLLASFPRETLNEMVHEVLILYPQSKYAIENERPLLHQRRGGRPGQVGCTYITFEWIHIKEVHRVLGPSKTPGCGKFIKHFRACFVKNVSNIGCTEIATQGRWCGIRIYGPEAESTNHYDIARYLNWRDVSSLCLDPAQDCALNVYAQSLGDDGKVKAPNKNRHIASFPVTSGGSIIMSKIATGCSGEGGYNGLPLTLPTIHHEKTYFTHQSEQIPCTRMALIVDFVKLDKKKYESFIQEKYIPDSLVFTPEIQAELTRQFQQPNTGPVRTIHQEKWLAQYHELIQYNKLNKDTNVPMPGKVATWVKVQRAQYKLFQEGKNNNMTEERIELLKAIGFTWSVIHRKECNVDDCKDRRWSSKNGCLYCKRHSDPSTRCVKCKHQGLPDGSATKLCSTCTMGLCRTKNCNNQLAEDSETNLCLTCSDCRLHKARKCRVEGCINVIVGNMGHKYCKKHRNRNTRCARCNVKGLEGGAKTFCLDCKENFRKEMEGIMIIN